MENSNWPEGGGESGELIRNFNWAATPLGPMQAWPERLRTLVELVLATPAPSALLWGKEGTLIYNDGYAAICGSKHPRVLGGTVHDAWPEAWDFNGEMLASGRAGKPQVFQNAHFVLERDGEMRDSWFDLYYAPVGRSDNGFDGVLATVVEITDRVKAEHEREEQARHLRDLNAELDSQRARLEIANRRLAGDMEFISNLFQSSPSFMAVLIGPDHRYELTNAAYDSLVQHRAVRGRPIQQVLPEIAEQGFIDLLNQVYRTGEPFHGHDAEVMFAPAGGGGRERRIVDFMFQPLKNDEGQTYGILVEGVDVTARALAQERLRVAQEAGGIGTFEWYPLRKELDVSDTYRQLWGIAADTPVTDDLLLGLVDAGWQEHSGVHRFGRWQNPLEYSEFPIRRADTGERRWIARRGQRVSIHEQEEPRYLGVAFDISDRKMAEQALRASESRLQAVFSQASVGISETDLDGRFVRVNHALCRLMQRDAQTMLGLTYRDVIHPEDLPESVERVRSAIVDGHPSALEKRYLRPDGSLVWAHTSIGRIVDSSGEPVSIIAVTTDLTDRRKVEAQLRELNESLERTVSNEVTERVKAEGALRHVQKMEAVGQLASGVAHDFNNVLQIISSNLQLMQRDAASLARGGERLAQALAAVARGSRLSMQLLAFGRKQALQPAITHFGILLEDIAPLLQRALGDRVTLSIDIAPGLWSASVDRNQLENAILNMAINARDAMQGQGQLKIAASNVVAADGSRHVALALADNGAGMPAEVLAKVFDPFYTTKEAGKGTGLGMSMVYGFVRQSGGTIRIDSAVGAGTTITIELPRVEGTHETDNETPAARVQGGSETILLVDDDAAIRAVTVDVLTGLGYRVLTAANGEQALDILKSNAVIDLLFSDVSMPGQVTSAELVRGAANLAPSMAILMTSGHAIDPSLLGDSIPAGIALLPKPYSLAQLARAAREQLDTRRAAPGQQPAIAGAPHKRGPLHFLVVEDDTGSRELACEMLQALGHQAHGVASAEQALGMLTQWPVDVLFTDLHLPGMPGDELAAQACAIMPALQVILASGEGIVEVGKAARPVLMLPKPYDLVQLQATISSIERAGGTGKPDSTPNAELLSRT